ncbi:MAG TPA: hypothetical protein VJN92_16805 [Candidatus Acidoferrum sp.]|nr:hypothetical protein [Candidatus Acidoferrum sp.]
MRVTAALVLVAVLFVGAEPNLVGQSSRAQTWNLPQGAPVKDTGTRTYRFTVDYNTANTKGEVIYRQHVAGEYTRGLPKGEVAWKNVTVADAAGPTAAFPAPQKRDFMEGFRYRNDLGSTTKPDFFKGFPPTAVVERNLVWDTGMLEMYGQNYFDHLKLNEPYRSMSNEDVAMPDVGTFHVRDTVLEWIGRSQRNGQDCALIRYQSFFNPLEIATGGMTLKGRSDYWGEIWVSLATKQIEYGTLYEVVVGEMKPPGQDTSQVVNVFRIGALEPVSAK